MVLETHGEEHTNRLAEHFLFAVQLLESVGADIHHVSDYKRGGKVASFTEFLVSKGQNFTLPTIRWLALEKKVNVQFMPVGARFQSLHDAKRHVAAVMPYSSETPLHDIDIHAGKRDLAAFREGFEKIRQQQASIFFCRTSGTFRRRRKGGGGG